MQACQQKGSAKSELLNYRVPAAEGEAETIYDLHGYRTNRSAIKKGEVVVKNGKKVLQGR